MATGNLGGGTRKGDDVVGKIGESTYRSRANDRRKQEEAFQAFSIKLRKKYALDEDKYRRKLEEEQNKYFEAKRRAQDREASANYKKITKEV